MLLKGSASDILVFLVVLDVIGRHFFVISDNIIMSHQEDEIREMDVDVSEEGHFVVEMVNGTRCS